MTSRVLIVDDEVRLAQVLAVGLSQHDLDVAVTGDPQEALAIVARERVDLVLTDLRMPGMDGRELMHRLRLDRPELPVVIMTAYTSVRDAVALVKEGAFDYIAKPFEIEDVLATIGRALKLRAVVEENERLRSVVETRFSFEHLLGNSPAFTEVLRQIGEVSGSRATVLLQGESGTGKERVAQAIHFNSPRRHKAFVALNCAAIPEQLLESELFGHVRGAFTGAVANRDGRFAAADGGTLFLDEVGDLPPSLQAKLLRVLQEQSFEPVGSNRTVTVDVRIVAATHRDLRQMVAAGTFRDDLFWRLNVFPLRLPALRERQKDIPILAGHFLREHAQAMGKQLLGFSPAAEAAMSSYSWPGNIRELQNCVERAVIVAQGSVVDVGDLPPYVFTSAPREIGAAQRIPDDLDGELARLERGFIESALRESDGVQVKAAQRLGITERSLWHRIKKLGIRIDKTVVGG